MTRALAILGLLMLAGCAERTVPVDQVATAPEVGPGVAGEVGTLEVVERRLAAVLAPVRGPRVVPASGEEMPVLRWAHRPEGERWTEATLVALRGHGAVLPASEPDGIDAWCPAYAEAPLEDREAFWAGLISALAKHESTYRPGAVGGGGGGRWFGLVQIAPATADGHGCRAQERRRAQGRGRERELRGADHGREGPRGRAAGAQDRLGLGAVPLRRQARGDARLGPRPALLRARLRAGPRGAARAARRRAWDARAAGTLGAMRRWGPKPCDGDPTCPRSTAPTFSYWPPTASSSPSS